MTKHKWLIAAALICGACLLFDPPLKAPRGEYAQVEIPGGYLLVSHGSCETVDLSIIKDRATLAVLNMRDVWRNAYPESRITVIAMPVVMSVDPWADSIQANGIYYADEAWIELRCGWEPVIEFELYHAIAHQLGIWCWEVIGGIHGSLDCNISELTTEGIYGTIASSPDLG